MQLTLVFEPQRNKIYAQTDAASTNHTCTANKFKVCVERGEVQIASKPLNLNRSMSLEPPPPTTYDTFQNAAGGGEAVHPCVRNQMQSI